MPTSPSFTPPPPLHFRLFPATDRPSQPLHDVRMALSDVEALGCGAYGHVVLRPVEDELGLDFPARVVPCRGVQAGHALMAEAAMAVFKGKQMGSMIEMHVADEKEEEEIGGAVTLQIVPLYHGQRQQQQQQQQQTPSQGLLEGAAHPLRTIATPRSLLFVKFLSLTLAYRVVKVERVDGSSSSSSSSSSSKQTTTTTTVVLITQQEEDKREAKKEERELKSTSSAFGASASQEIIEMIEQSKTRDDAFRMQGVLLSAPRGAGKTFFLQQLQRQLTTKMTTKTKAVYVRGKDVLEALMAAEENGGGKNKEEGGREGGEEDGDGCLRQQLGLSFSGNEERAVVLLIDDFDAILYGGEEGGMEEGGAATQEEMEEELQVRGREATRALKMLQRLLKVPATAAVAAVAGRQRPRPVSWVLATRESISGSGGGGGGSRQRRLTRLHGRLFDKVLELPPPRPEDRVKILQYILERTAPTLLPNDDKEEEEEGREEGGLLQRVGEMTGGFLPGDMVTLCQVAALQALASTAAAAERANGNAEEGLRKAASSFSSSYSRSLSAFVAARREVSPAVLSGLADRDNNKGDGDTSKKLCWASVGGYEDVKYRLRKLVEWPMLYSETFARLGLRGPHTSSSSSSSSSNMPSGGIILYGPSGCGKSLLARVLAEEVKANFVELPASEVFSPFLGDSEARVRNAFARARRAAPCILFLDELDAMAAGRGVGGEGGGGEGGSGGVYARVLSTLLNEMDGVSGQAQGLLVLAATNRREAVDAALLRPGRLQESLLVPYPRPDLDYLPILQVATRRMPLHTDVDLGQLVTNVLKPLVDGGGREEKIVTPANLVALCREAGLACLRETEGEGEGEEEVDDGNLVVCQEHFVQAAAKLLGE